MKYQCQFDQTINQWIRCLHFSSTSCLSLVHPTKFLTSSNTVYKGLWWGWQNNKVTNIKILGIIFSKYQNPCLLQLISDPYLSFGSHSHHTLAQLLHESCKNVLIKNIPSFLPIHTSKRQNYQEFQASLAKLENMQQYKQFILLHVLYLS